MESWGDPWGPIPIVFICKGSQALPECCPRGLTPSSALGDGIMGRRAGAGAAQAPPLVRCPHASTTSVRVHSRQPPLRAHLSFLLPAAWTVGWAFTPRGRRDLKILGALEVLKLILLVLHLRGVNGQPVRDCPPRLLGLAPLLGVVRGPVGTATCSCDQRHAIPPG